MWNSKVVLSPGKHEKLFPLSIYRPEMLALVLLD